MGYNDYELCKAEERALYRIRDQIQESNNCLIQELKQINRSFRDFNFINQASLNKMLTAWPRINNDKHLYMIDRNNHYEFRVFELEQTLTIHRDASFFSHESKMNLLCAEQKIDFQTMEEYQKKHYYDFAFYVQSLAFLRHRDLEKCKKNSQIAIQVFIPVDTYFVSYPHPKHQKIEDLDDKYQCSYYDDGKRLLREPLFYKEYPSTDMEIMPSWREILFDFKYCLQE